VYKRRWQDDAEIRLAVKEFRKTGNTMWLDNIVYDQAFLSMLGETLELPSDIIVAIELEGANVCSLAMN
jgi:hypothetical protein